MKLLLVALIGVTILGLSYHSVFLTWAEAGPASQSAEDSLQNYDIRTDTSRESVATLARMRGAAKLDLQRSSDTSDSRFKIEYNDALGIAEVITSRDANTPLTPASNISRARVLKNFITSNGVIFRIDKLAQLKTTADYSNPDGKLSFVRFEQLIGDIPVFGAEIKAGFTRRNEMFRVINSAAPGVDSKDVSSDFGTAETAVVRAAPHIGAQVSASDLLGQNSTSSNQVEFSAAVFSDKIVADKFYFPIGNGLVRPAWRILLVTDVSAYYVVVDAADGTLLWRRNLIENQTAPATYNVYGNTTSLLKSADSPSPFTPGCLAPTGCAQPTAIPRTSFTLVGNEAPYTFNNLGWIPDTGLPVRTPANPNITDGNNVEAGIDRMNPNGVDDNGWAFGTPSRVFNYSYNPAPGIPPPGEEPLPPLPQPYPPSAFQQGSITHGFYLINRWHDEMYRFGFTEQAGNFQHFNFGRGGVEGDRVALDLQDGSGTNSSNFSIAADGIRPRLQMFIWTGSTPDRDGALDSQVVLHEMTHGLTTRLHGNATGLNSNMARGMGEGWSDFYAMALLSEPTDDPLGTHALGGYITYLIFTDYEANYYYGLRRFPVAVWASRGPNGLPHNPLTFRYLNNNCTTLIGTDVTNPNSAYPRGPIGASSNCDQIHNLGEVWAVTLWEVRDQLIQRHGAAEGNRRALQYITDGMKLSPLNPSMLQARDSILAAVSASDALDVGPVWRGFAIRGMGSNAAIINTGTGNNNTVVTESFDMPIQFRRRGRVDFDGDGKSDISVFRPSNRVWYLNRSFSGFAAVEWGLATDKLVPDDYDGDGKTDFAVFRATSDGATPDYYILRSTDSTIQYIWWGTAGDIPLSEDFDGDGKGDPAIFRPSIETGQFWVRRSSDGSILVSTPIVGGVPLAGDFDGDRRGDFATYTNGFWRILRSETGYAPGFLINWGIAGDKVVHSDYDGDGKDDLAVYRPSDGTWYITQSSGGNRVQNFGISTDIPVPADYDGDGRADIAVYRNGVWYIDRSTSGILITGFGLAGDTPLPATYLP